MLQSGRSMVEMLGALAIIGVLSIGGIAGYSYGMDKHKANQTLQEVRLKAIDILAQFNQRNGEGINIDSWEPKTSTGYTIGLEEETIGIQIEDVEQRVCELMSEAIANEAAVKINTVIYEDNNTSVACGEKNTMVFYFDTNAEDGGCNGPIIDDECQPCVGNLVWDDKYEMCLCEYDTEYLGDDGTCKTCPEYARASDDGLECVCPEGYGWNSETNQCEDASVCKVSLIAAGFSEDNFTISGTTITYDGDMLVNKDLDISTCDLTVNGTLSISGKTLKVHNVFAESSTGEGISLTSNGKLLSSGNVEGKTSYNGIHIYAVRVSSGCTLEAAGNVTGTATNGGTYSTGIYSEGTLKSGGNLVGSTTANDSYAKGISITKGTVNTNGSMSGSTNTSGSHSDGIAISGGSLTVDGNIVGNLMTSNTHCSGISISSGTIVANGDIIANADSDESYLTGMDITGGNVTARNITATVKSEETNIVGLDLSGYSNPVVNAKNDIIGTVIQQTGNLLSKPGINAEQGKMTAGGIIKGVSRATGINVGNVTLTAPQIIGEGYAAFRSSYSGSATLNGDVIANGEGYGIELDTTLTINGNATLTATGTYGYGINFDGYQDSLTITGNLTASGTKYGAYFDEVVVNVGGYVNASSPSGSGLYMTGYNTRVCTLTVGDYVIGTGSTYGLYLYDNANTITAPNIYYCTQKYGSATFNGTVSQKCM